MRRFVLAVDQGTTSTKAFLLDREGNLLASAGVPITQHYPKPGYVEHDPDEIWFSVLRSIADLFIRYEIKEGEIVSMGITNQRETSIAFSRKTLRPYHPAICWQCRRTADICKRSEYLSREKEISSKTGLKLDPYFSATKFRYILENADGASEAAKNGDLFLSTVDAYLVYRLTDKKVFATDYSNASRTMLFDITNLRYDEELLRLFDIDKACLAEPKPSCADYGTVDIDLDDIPLTGKEVKALSALNGVRITAVAGDQAAALYGQTCFEKGQSKTTFGTGCFTLMNTGTEPVFSDNGLLTSAAWSRNGETFYALEGSVFQGGSIISWLKDEMGLIKQPSDCDRICQSLDDNGGVYFVPAFTGLGAPYWDPDVRGAVLGLTRGTGGDYIVRAGVESIAYQVALLVFLMRKETGLTGGDMKVDGGVCACDFLMQLQSDLIRGSVIRAGTDEMTGTGVAFLSGLMSGFYGSEEDIVKLYKPRKVYRPVRDEAEAERLLDGYKRAVGTLLR